MSNVSTDAIETRLTGAYDRGLLVPFLGAGMSYPACPLWDGFVTELELESDTEPAPATADLVHRAARAARRLRHDVSREFPSAVRAALTSRPQQPPPQTRSLAQVHWPLVLTTNYDDLFVAASHEAYEQTVVRRRDDPPVVPLRLLGRSASDCQRVLMALRRPEVPVLWALQGFVGGQAAIWPRQAFGDEETPYETLATTDEQYRSQIEALQRQLVIGHAEYRHVVLNSHAFRRAFAEVFRTRSLLFLGSGLTDKYFLDLISEVIELHGPSPLPHYAYMLEGQVDTAFLRDYFGIWVLELAEHDELPQRIDALAGRITEDRRCQTEWRLGPARPPSEGSDPVAGRQVAVVRGQLPASPGPDGCLVISAGGTPGRLRLSNVGKGLLDGLGFSHEREHFVRIDDGGRESLPIWQHADAPYVLAVNARMSPWSEQGALLRPLDPTVVPIGSRPHPTENARTLRDVRIVEHATRQMMECAGRIGFRNVHSMLLAAGGHRTFPRSFALLQMIRGWARFQNSVRDASSLTIHVPDRTTEVLLDIQSGRLDLSVGLDPETVEFWVEIDGTNGEANRYLAAERTDRQVLDFAAAFDIETDDWRLDLDPSPTHGWANWTVGAVRRWEAQFGQSMDLQRFGVLPGTLITMSAPRRERRT